MAPPKAAEFPLGVFDDAGVLGGDTVKFRTMVNDLKAHGLDSVMFANNFVKRDATLLGVADQRNFNVYMTPGGDLNSNWWPSSVTADLATARSVAQPIVSLLSPHASFKGYIVKDEPGLSDLMKVTLMTQALHEIDPARLTMSILVGVDRVGPIFTTSRSDVMLIDAYPVAYNNAACDFTMTGFGYPMLDFVSYIRIVTHSKPANTALWIILQTHNFGAGESFSLRTPSPAEVREEQWLAIGEGATGVFWFIYSSEQGWTGLADNPMLYSEVSRLANRVAPLRNTLLGLHKVADQFTITGPGNPYVSTLASLDGQRTYVVAVNRDCVHSQVLSIQSSSVAGHLRNVENGWSYPLDQPIRFQPGDGMIFELVKAS